MREKENLNFSPRLSGLNAVLDADHHPNQEEVDDQAHEAGGEENRSCLIILSLSLSLFPSSPPRPKSRKSRKNPDPADSCMIHPSIPEACMLLIMFPRLFCSSFTPGLRQVSLLQPSRHLVHTHSCLFPSRFLFLSFPVSSPQVASCPSFPFFCCLSPLPSFSTDENQVSKFKNTSDESLLDLHSLA